MIRYQETDSTTNKLNFSVSMKITGSNLHALYVQSIGSDKLNVEMESSLSRQQDLYFACLVRVKMTTVVNEIDKK